MLQELAAQTGASAWTIASMVFFIGAWVWIAIRVYRARPEDMSAHARMALDGDEPAATGAAESLGTKA
jgi:hypothetical protein